MTQCRRCGKECGDYGYENTLYNPWIDIRERFTLCSACQRRFGQRVLAFLNEYEEAKE